MTNEQTLILLKNLLARLESAVEQTESMMPDSERKTVKRHKRVGLISMCPKSNCEVPDHHYESIEIPALNPIHDLLDSLQDEIELLMPKKEDPYKIRARRA